jgi:hypothetical protein
MAFETRHTNDLIRILLSGGGLDLDASLRPTDDLIRMALAAKQSGASLTLRRLDPRLPEELVRIALAGGARVVFG